jgi:hypothetical protein
MGGKSMRAPFGAQKFLTPQQSFGFLARKSVAF